MSEEQVVVWDDFIYLLDGLSKINGYVNNIELEVNKAVIGDREYSEPPTTFHAIITISIDFHYSEFTGKGEQDIHVMQVNYFQCTEHAIVQPHFELKYFKKLINMITRHVPESEIVAYVRKINTRNKSELKFKIVDIFKKQIFEPQTLKKNQTSLKYT